MFYAFRDIGFILIKYCRSCLVFSVRSKSKTSPSPRVICDLSRSRAALIWFWDYTKIRRQKNFFDYPSVLFQSQLNQDIQKLWVRNPGDASGPRGDGGWGQPGNSVDFQKPKPARFIQDKIGAGQAAAAHGSMDFQSQTLNVLG